MQAHWELTKNDVVKKIPFLFAPFDGALERHVAQYVAPDLLLEFPNDQTTWALGAHYGAAYNAATLTNKIDNPRKYDKAPFPFVTGATFVEQRPAPPPRLNVLYFPTVASRFAHILAIIDDKDVEVGTKLRLKTDVPIIKDAPFFFGITEQKHLDLYVVSKRPIDLKTAEGWNAPKKSPALCLLVDWRYFMRGAQYRSIYPVQKYPFGDGRKSVSMTMDGLWGNLGETIVLKSIFWRVFNSGFFTEEDWTRATSAPSKFRASTSTSYQPSDWFPFGNTSSSVTEQSNKEKAAFFCDGSPLLPTLDAALALYGVRLYKGAPPPTNAFALAEIDQKLTFLETKTMAEAAEELNQTSENPIGTTNAQGTTEWTNAKPFSRYPARVLFPIARLSEEETEEAGTLDDYAHLYDTNRQTYFPTETDDEDDPNDENEEQDPEPSPDEPPLLCDATDGEIVGDFFAPKYWEFRKGDKTTTYLANQWKTLAPSKENETGKCAPVVITRYFATIDSDGKVRNAQDVRQKARLINAVVESLASLTDGYSLFFGARNASGAVVYLVDDATIKRPQNFSAFVPNPAFVPVFGDAPRPIAAPDESAIQYVLTTVSPSTATTNTEYDDNDVPIKKTWTTTAKLWLENYHYDANSSKWIAGGTGGSSSNFRAGVASIQYDDDYFSVGRNLVTPGQYAANINVLNWRGCKYQNANSTGAIGSTDYFKKLQILEPLVITNDNGVTTLSFKDGALELNNVAHNGVPVVTGVSLKTSNTNYTGSIPVRVPNSSFEVGAPTEVTKYLYLEIAIGYLHLKTA